jgi:hypothetical protein
MKASNLANRFGFVAETFEESASFVRSLNRSWVGRICLIGTLLLSGCLNALPTQHEGWFEPNIPAFSEPPVFPSQRKDGVDLLWDGLQALPAEGLVNAPQKTTNLWQRIRAGLQVPLPGAQAAQRLARHERWYLENSAHLQRTPIRRDMDMTLATKFAGMGVELAQLRAWNPKIKSLRRGTIQQRLPPATLDASHPSTRTA